MGDIGHRRLRDREAAIVQVRDDEGLNPNNSARRKRNEWQSHVSYI